MSKTPSLGTGEAMPISQNIEITLKGIEHCEAQRQALIRKEASEIIEGCLDLVERMLRVLDRLEGDADFEADTDDEYDPAHDEPTAQPLTLNREGMA